MPRSCGGGYLYGGRFFRCWNHSGHGVTTLTSALAQSCDVYYYQLGLKLGVDRLATWAKKIGLGERTGFDLPQERSGLVPTSAYFDKWRGDGKWTDGVTLNLAIGQGENLYTPLQIAGIAVAVASRGRLPRPHVVQDVLDPMTGAATPVPQTPRNALHLPEETWDALSAAMEQVVAGGTGGAARVPGVRIGGKTGTAQNSSGQDHALFICYAPVERPEIAIAVVVENGGHGGSTAAPIAQKALEADLAPEILLAKKAALAVRRDTLVAATPPRAAVPDSLLGD
jgi:penicillin-binding protein 2